MEFAFTPQQQQFRREVRRFIDEHLPADWDQRSDGGESFAEAIWDDIRTFQSALAARGWLTIAWPEEYGGRAASYWDQLILNEEMAYHRAPNTNHGITWVGPAMMLYGSEAQQAEHVGAIARGETWWCTLYSEPGAGSDLAGLQTRATEDGDDYVINGQKIWTSGGHRADFGWLAARTDPDAPKHRGISMFILDMHSPGVTVQPLVNMAGAHSFNQVFFDDVRVPKSRLVGELNRGWYHLAVALDFERSGIGAFAGGRRTLEEIVQFAQESPAHLMRNPGVRYGLAARAVEVQVGKSLGYRIVSLQSQGVIANHEASCSKVFGSELGQRIARTGLELVGLYGGLESGSHEWAPLQGRLERDYLSSVLRTIAAGTSEVQRNIIATRGLGLPRA